MVEIDLLKNIPLTTEKGIRNSILIDYSVYRWFLYVLQQSAVRSSLLERLPLEQEYRSLKRYGLVSLSAGILSLLCFAGKFFLTRGDCLWGGIFLALVAMLFHYKRRGCVSILGWKFVESCFSPIELQQSTLYQLSEQIAQVYDVVSLVDALYHLEKYYKGAFLFSFLTFGYILYVGAWVMRILGFVFLYFFIVWTLNLPVCYRGFKRV